MAIVGERYPARDGKTSQKSFQIKRTTPLPSPRFVRFGKVATLVQSPSFVWPTGQGWTYSINSLADFDRPPPRQGSRLLYLHSLIPLPEHQVDYSFESEDYRKIASICNPLTAVVIFEDQS